MTDDSLAFKHIDSAKYFLYLGSVELQTRAMRYFESSYVHVNGFFVFYTLIII